MPGCVRGAVPARWGAVAVLMLLGLALQTKAGAQAEYLLHVFSQASGSGGYYPKSGLVVDSDGNLYGTTYQGGLMTCGLGTPPPGCGTVFELTRSGGSYTETVLYAFGATVGDGLNPASDLTLDTQGDIFGTTINGGSSNCPSRQGCGTIFELVKSGGGYTEKILHNFGEVAGDGAYPVGPVVADAAGDLFGATFEGGTSPLAFCQNQCGTVYELVNGASGYTERVLYNFGASTWDGENPKGGLLLDAAGDLFGTTNSGGKCNNGSPGCGTAFELVNASGSYAEKLLYDFGGLNGDGGGPVGTQLRDAGGDLFGVTSGGGGGTDHEGGTVYELVNSLGAYSETVLYDFMGVPDGESPQAGLIMDAAGDLFGTASAGGFTTTTGTGGTIFEMAKGSSGYTEKTLWRFGVYEGDGTAPLADLVMDAEGNLYGTTEITSQQPYATNSGAVFEFSPTGANPVISLSTMQLNYNFVPVGSTSQLTLTATNIGTAPLIFPAGAATVGGAGGATAAPPGDFAVGTDTCSDQAVAPGASCSIAVDFTPSVILNNPETALLAISSDAQASPQGVFLRGSGAAPVQLSWGLFTTNSDPTWPSAIGLATPAEQVGQTSLWQQVTVSYEGYTTMTISSIGISGADAGDFAIVPAGTTCAAGQTLPASGSCTIAVAFTPVAAGARSATLTITDSAYGSPEAVALSGNGVGAGLASLAVLASVGDAFDSNYNSTLAEDGNGNVFGIAGDSFGNDWQIFELVKQGGGYTERVLGRFAGYTGQLIVSGVAIDSSADVFAAIPAGGTAGKGMVVELVNSSGTYTEKVLYNFTGAAGDGAEPSASPVLDSAGNVYGVTSGGGTSGAGTVYELVNAAGNYAEKILYSVAPTSGVINTPTLDAAGDLFCSTQQGGANGDGMIFELVNSNGTFAARQLYSFAMPAGAEPVGPLALDATGDIFGATFLGGTAQCGVPGFNVYTCGAIYELVNSEGSYSETTLHIFNGLEGDGANPGGGVVLDAAGDLYGTAPGKAASCGDSSCEGGAIYEILNQEGTYAERILARPPAGALTSPFGTPLREPGGDLIAFGLNAVFELTPPAGPVLFFPPDVQFSSQAQDSESAEQATSLTNVEVPGLTVSNVGLVGAGAGSFALDPAASNCAGATMAVGQQCEVSVIFDPGAAGAQGASLVVTDSAGTQTAALTGAGTATGVSLSASQIVFAPQGVATRSPAASVSLTNNTSAAVSLTGVTVGGANGADFAVAAGSGCAAGTDLAAGASCTITMSFTPSLAGSELGSVAVNDSAGTQTLTLVGTGSRPTLALSTGVLSFSSVAAGSASAAESVAMTNTGPVGLAITGASLGGASANEFAVLPSASSCLGTVTAPGATCGVAVLFTPGGSGLRTATLTITDNTANSPHTVALTGSETGAAVAFSPLSVLYNFAGQAADGDGEWPEAPVTEDSAGDLFGTTWTGGGTPGCPSFTSGYDANGNAASVGGCGTLFELVKSGSGYSERVLHNFASGGTDGYSPSGRLSADSSGDLFGAETGGLNRDGAVFEFLNAGGTYTEKLLYTFGSSPGDAAGPVGDLTGDGAGDWFGATQSGGAATCACGAVYELVDSAGTYTEKVLYSFVGGTDGSTPLAGLVRDANGNLYGTTYAGGAQGKGTVFELVNSGAAYTETVLHSFGASPADGTQPRGELLMDDNGDLFGTAETGGANGDGAVFELLESSGQYAEKVLYSFTGTGGDGGLPVGPLVSDGSGNLYGITQGGGTGGNGTIFELVNLGGSYGEQVLVDLTAATGFDPYGGLTKDAAGDLFGTASQGGQYGYFTAAETEIGPGGNGYGTVYELAAKLGPIAVAPASLDFAASAVGEPTPAQGVTLTNGGSGAVVLGKISVVGAGAAAFALSGDNCSGTTLAPGSSCTVSVGYTPAAGGTTAAALSFPDNAAGSPQAVTLMGTAPGPAVGLAPASLTFASQLIGSASMPQSITLSNSGQAALNISSIAAGGDFAETNSCPASLAPAASCTISVDFTPQAAGARSGAVTVTDSAADSPETVALTGTGTAPAPAAALAPAALSFGGETVGVASAAQAVTLTNGGTGALAISGIAASGDFSETNNCPASVAAQASCTISVVFTPAAAGARTGALTVTDNAAGSPQTAALSGTGAAAATPAVSLSPSSLTFASQLTGAASAAQTITLTNTGQAALLISAIAASGDFSETNTCGASVEAGKNCAIAVTFKPTATGARTGQLSVTDNAADSPESAALSGTGADVTITPGSGSSASSTVAAGQTASYGLSFAPVSGATGTFTLTCTGAPTGATCTPTPATITLSGTQPVAATVAVTTTARSLAPPLAPGRGPWLPWAALLLLMPAALLLRERRRWLLPATCAGLLTLMMACGGGSGGSGPPPPPPPPAAPAGTPAGTYTLTVTATGAGGVTRSTTLTLTVQ